MMGSSSSSSSSGRWCLVMFAVMSALCVSGPALYWKFHRSIPHFTCPPCSCHCPPPPSLLRFAPGLLNLTTTDCGGNDPEVKQEMGKEFVDLLTEELKLQKGVSSEHAQHMNATLSDARRVASQYQREADKCVAATETCEGARERSEALLRNEIKLTLLWEQRARHLGWHPESL